LDVENSLATAVVNRIYKLMVLQSLFKLRFYA